MIEPGPDSGGGGIRPRRTPVADLFEQTFRVYWRSFPVITPVYAVFAIPAVLAALPLNVWQAQWSRSLYIPSSAERLAALEQLGPFIASALVVGVAGLILGTFGSAGVVYVAGRASSGERPSVRDVLLVVRQLTPEILGYVVLMIAGVLVLTIGFVAVALLGAKAIGFAASSGDAAFVAVVIGLVGIPVLIVLVSRLSLAIPVLVLERSTPLGALQRSWRLVTGATLRTFGIVLLAGLVISVIAGVATPFYLPGVFEGLLTGSVGAYVFITLVGGLVGTLLGPIVPTLLTVVYFDYQAYRP